MGLFLVTFGPKGWCWHRVNHVPIIENKLVVPHKRARTHAHTHTGTHKQRISSAFKYECTTTELILAQVKSYQWQMKKHEKQQSDDEAAKTWWEHVQNRQDSRFISSSGCFLTDLRLLVSQFGLGNTLFGRSQSIKIIHDEGFTLWSVQQIASQAWWRL